jgi:outer membrane lipoprotein-sorting protein
MKLKAVFTPAALVAALIFAGPCALRVTPANAAPAHLAPQQAASTSEAQTQNFAGKIVSQNGVRFILRDDQENVWYHIDDQQQAAKFLGKVVNITGTLDGQTDMIHVRTITEAKA